MKRQKKKGIQLANYNEKGPTLLVIRETQIKVKSDVLVPSKKSRTLKWHLAMDKQNTGK